MTEKPLELTILMPCLDEAETIEVCVKKALDYLKKNKIRGEVLIADNGSTDGSQTRAENMGARVVHAKIRGYGGALITGIKAAKGTFVIMGDADDSYDFSRLDHFVERLRNGAELVMGNRFAGGIAKGAMPPLHRYLGNPVLSFIGRLFFQIPVRDFHCGLRGFNRDKIRALKLQSHGMEFASEMVVKASLWKLKIEQVPTTLSPDGRSRSPHLNSWRDGWRHLRFLVMHSPKWLFAFPGFALLFIGLFGVAVLAIGPVQINTHLQLDTHSFAAACFMVLIGAQLIMFALLSRRYAAATQMLPPARSEYMTGFLQNLTLERVLLGCLALLVSGLVGGGYAVWQWASLDFGNIDNPAILRLLLGSFTLITLAVQTAAGAFFAALLSVTPDV